MSSIVYVFVNILTTNFSQMWLNFPLSETIFVWIIIKINIINFN